jgi:MraZ protein
MTVKANRDFKRFILGGSGEIEADKQGRVLVSQTLREHAGLESGKAVWIGVGDKAEIWSEQR